MIIAVFIITFLIILALLCIEANIKERAIGLRPFQIWIFERVGAILKRPGMWVGAMDGSAHALESTILILLCAANYKNEALINDGTGVWPRYKKFSRLKLGNRGSFSPTYLLELNEMVAHLKEFAVLEQVLLKLN